MDAAASEQPRAFLAVVADAINSGEYPDPPPLHVFFATPAARAVLAMPEMQALRQFVRDAANDAVYDDERVNWLGLCGIPESVARWVLAEPYTSPARSD